MTNKIHFYIQGASWDMAPGVATPFALGHSRHCVMALLYRLKSLGLPRHEYVSYVNIIPLNFMNQSIVKNIVSKLKHLLIHLWQSVTHVEIIIMIEV